MDVDQCPKGEGETLGNFPTHVHTTWTGKMQQKYLLTQIYSISQVVKPLDVTSTMDVAMDSTNPLINPQEITVFIKILLEKDLTLLLDHLATAALKNEKLT